MGSSWHPAELSHWEGFASRGLAEAVLPGGVRLRARCPQQAQSGLETWDISCTGGRRHKLGVN